MSIKNSIEDAIADMTSTVTAALTTLDEVMDNIVTIDLNNPDIALDDAKTSLQEAINYLKDI